MLKKDGVSQKIDQYFQNKNKFNAAKTYYSDTLHYLMREYAYQGLTLQMDIEYFGIFNELGKKFDVVFPKLNYSVNRKMLIRKSFSNVEVQISFDESSGDKIYKIVIKMLTSKTSEEFFVHHETMELYDTDIDHFLCNAQEDYDYPKVQFFQDNKEMDFSKEIFLYDMFLFRMEQIKIRDRYTSEKKVYVCGELIYSSMEDEI